ncbi:MAG: phage/plasmid primase, P4 family [Comamonadaceae bacterium]|nr:phage/plasmid primase, P4 family [Comamonadaceae bacterium]
MMHACLEFLHQLDPSPSATFNIECYTDAPKGVDKPKPDPLLRRYPTLAIGQVEGLIPELEKLNEQTVTRIRGIHADMDDVTPDQLSAVAAVLVPSITVQSSAPERQQLYWLLKADEVLQKDEAKAINQRLVGYGADKAAVDSSRLLRIAGFKHMKYRQEGRTPSVSAVYSGATYTADEIRAAFPPQTTLTKTRATPVTINQQLPAASDLSTQLVNAIERAVASTERQLWAGNWQAIGQFGQQTYPSQSEADMALANGIVKACLQHGVHSADLSATVEHIFGRSGLGTRDKWTYRPDYRSRTIDAAIRASGTTSTSTPSPALLLDSQGDIRNAKAFAQAARSEFLHVSTRDSWLHWKNDQWHVCEKQEEVAKAKQVCAQMLTAAHAVWVHEPERGKRLLREAEQAHTLTRITAMLKLAISEPDMAVTDRELDSDPYRLGVRNGVVDLRTGTNHPNHPGLHITRYCNASFDPAATCERWLIFLDEIFAGDAETIACVQRLLGLTLLGIPNEEVLIICYGHGANGKSVFSNVVHHIMGGYAVTAPSTLLTARRADDTGPRSDLAALAGARYVSINELQAGDRLDEQVVKAIAGREPIAARFMYRDFFQFLPSFTPWLRTNHKPIITGEDDGIWRRLVMLKFSRRFTQAQQDPHLEDTLLTECNGILRWMVEGAQKYLADGIKPSKSMQAELRTYRQDSDLLGEFLADKTRFDSSAQVPQQLLFSRYSHWRMESCVRPISKKQFTQRLMERGFSEAKSGSNRYYVGLALHEGGGGGVLPTRGGNLDMLDGMSTTSGKVPI